MVVNGVNGEQARGPTAESSSALKLSRSALIARQLEAVEEWLLWGVESEARKVQNLKTTPVIEIVPIMSFLLSYHTISTS